MDASSPCLVSLFYFPLYLLFPLLHLLTPSTTLSPPRQTCTSTHIVSLHRPVTLMPTFITPDREPSRHSYVSYDYIFIYIFFLSILFLFILPPYLSVYLHMSPPTYSRTPLHTLPHIPMPLLTPRPPYGIHHSVGSYEPHSHCLAFHPADCTQ